MLLETLTRKKMLYVEGGVLLGALAGAYVIFKKKQMKPLLFVGLAAAGGVAGYLGYLALKSKEEKKNQEGK